MKAFLWFFECLFGHTKLLYFLFWLNCAIIAILSILEVKIFSFSQVHDDLRSFVLEIGTEEMPPQDVVNASEQVLLFL